MKKRNGNGTDGQDQVLSINQKYQALGGSSGFLGAPLSLEVYTADGIGRCRQYQGGSIYWEPTVGAYEVHGAIRDKWMSLGAETSALGYPISDERGTPDRVGRFSEFTNGVIYWTPSTGAHEVHGPIQEKWGDVGWEGGYYGYPISDEMTDIDGVSRFNNFEGGLIHWSPTVGAFPCPEEAKVWVYLTRQPPLVGIIPYVGSFPTIGSITGNLKDITNMAVPILSFVKPGVSTDRCNDDAAVVRLGYRMTTSSNDMTAIYGTPTPPLPANFVACVAGVSSGPDLAPIVITYNFIRRH